MFWSHRETLSITGDQRMTCREGGKKPSLKYPYELIWQRHGKCSPQGDEVSPLVMKMRWVPGIPAARRQTLELSSGIRAEQS